jgi:hypothetical protein
MAERPVEAGQDCVATLTFKSLRLPNASVLKTEFSDWDVQVAFEGQQLNVQVDNLDGRVRTSLGEVQAVINQGCGQSVPIELRVTITGRGEQNAFEGRYSSNVWSQFGSSPKRSCPSITRNIKLSAAPWLRRDQFDQLPPSKRQSVNPLSPTVERHFLSPRRLADNPLTRRVFRRQTQRLRFKVVFDLELTCADSEVMQHSVGG